MKVLEVAAVAALTWLAAGLPASAEVHLTIHDGRVSIVAKDATVRQILTEWARIGQTNIVNVERIPGDPLTLELANVPEAEALDVLLRSISGYMAAPRAVMAANVSQFDRIVVMPTTAPPRQAVSAAAPPPQPTFQQPQVQQQFPQQAIEDDTDTERPATNVVVPGQPRGPVFSQFPPPQVVNPQGGPGVMPQAGGGVFNPQLPQLFQPPLGQPQQQVGQPQQINQQPPYGQPQPPAAPGAFPTSAPGSVAIPGMVAPAPPQQPATIITSPQTPTPRRPGGSDGR